MFERRHDGTVRMTFKPPPSAPQEPPWLSFTYSSMITAVQTTQEDLPITGFNSEGYPIYPAKHNGHFLWDAPGSGMCDPNYPPPPPAPLPIYRKELKWIAKHCTSEIPSPLSDLTPIVQPLACMMFSSTSSDYSSSFPPLEPHTDSQRHVLSKPFIHSPITSIGHLEPPKPFESVLNWQTQNARAQNDTLLHLNSKVEHINLRTEQIETKVDSIIAQMQQIHQNLHSRIGQLDSKLRAMLAHRYNGPEFDQKEWEIRRLKAELAQIESEKQRPTLFTTSPHIPSIGPTYHPFASILSPIKQYDPSKLFCMTHTLFRDNPLPPPPKPKPNPRPQPRPAPLHPSSLTIPGQPSPTFTPTSPPALLSVPTQSKDKEPMHQFTAHTVDHSSTTDNQTSDSNLAVSDSPTETNTESSASTSDSEKSYADITKILMAQPDPPTQGQPSHTEPYVDIPSEVEEEMPESSATNRPSPAQPNPPSQKSSNGPWFTFDDLPSHKWRDRLNEMSAWIDLQMLRTGATTQSVLREFATRFTGALRDWFDSLGQYRQLQFVDLPEVSSALVVLHDQFLGDPSAVFEAARRDYLNMKCCSLNAKDLDFHYKRMSLLFYKLNGFNEPTLKHVFLASLPEELQPDIQRQLIASNLSLDNISLGKIFQLAKTCLDKLCEQKQFFKELLKDKEPFQSACTKPYLQIKCHKKKDCDCDPESPTGSSERNLPPPENSNECNQADVSSAREKATMPKFIPIKEKNPSDEPNDETVFALQNSSDSDSDQSQVIFHQQLLSLDTTVPIPSIKLQILPSKFQRPIPAIGFIDTGAQRSMLNPHILPSEYWTQSEEHFKAVNGKLFTTSLITKKPIGIQIFPNCVIWTKVIGSTLPNKDILIGFDILHQIKHLQTIPTGIRVKSMFKPFTNILKLYHLSEIPQSYQDISTKLLSFCPESHSEFTHPNPLWKNKSFFIKLPFKLNEDINPTKATHPGMSPSDLLLAQQECSQLLAQGLIEPKSSQWACQAFYVEKHSEIVRGKKRLVIDYQPLNMFLQDDKFPLPRRQSMFNFLKNAQIFSNFDLKSGFWQLGIEPSERYKTAFCIPNAHFQWTVLPFGLKTAPSIFQKSMVQLFQPILHHALIYIDDILLFSGSHDDHRQLLTQFYDIIQSHGIMLSAKKSTIATDNIEFLGMIIKDGHYQPEKHIAQELLHFPDQQLSKRQIQQFLGIINYIRDFLPHVDHHTHHLSALLKKQPPEWNADHTAATDASDESWGAILLEELNDKEHFIAYASGHFSETQKHYHSVFKEILAVKNGIKKFEYHLIGHHFLIRMDSSAFPNIFHFKGLTLDPTRDTTEDVLWYIWCLTVLYATKLVLPISPTLDHLLNPDNATSLTWTLLEWYSPIPWWRKKLQQLSEIYNLDRMPAPKAQLFTSVFIIHRPYFQHPDTNLFWTQDQDSQDPWEDFLPLSQHLHQFPQPTMDEPGPSEPGPSTQPSKRLAQPSKVDKATQTSPKYTPKCTPRDYNCPYPPCRGPSFVKVFVSMLYLLSICQSLDRWAWLSKKTDTQTRVTSKPFVQSPVTASRQPEEPKQYETVLNWQTKNASAQNQTLQQLGKKIDRVASQVSQTETKVDSISSRLDQMYIHLQDRISELDTDLRRMINNHIWGPEFNKQEAEIRKLKAELSRIDAEKTRPSLFTQPQPTPISPPFFETYAPFYTPSHLFIISILMATETADPSASTSTPIVDDNPSDQASHTDPVPPPVHEHSTKPSSACWFTFDDIPRHKWAARLQEFAAWIDLQGTKPNAQPQAVLREFMARSTGSLRDWLESLGEYRQLQFMESPIGTALSIIRKIFQMAMLSLDKICEQKAFFKDLMEDKKPFSEACKKPYLKIECKDEKKCVCPTTKKRHFRKHFHRKSTSKKPFRYFKKKDVSQYRKKKSNRCFVCKKRGHFARNCPHKSAKVVRLIQHLQHSSLLSENEDVKSNFSEQSAQDDQTAFLIAESSDSDDISVISTVQTVNHVSTIPRPSLKMSILPSKYHKHVPVIGFINTGADTSMIDPYVLPPDCWEHHSKLFRAVNGETFETTLITKKPVGIQFFPNCIIWKKIVASKLPDKDLLIGFDILHLVKNLFLSSSRVRYKQMFLLYTNTLRLYNGPEFDQKEREIRRLKAELAQIPYPPCRGPSCTWHHAFRKEKQLKKQCPSWGPAQTEAVKQLKVIAQSPPPL
ncbi:hypothetical protein KPL71_014584 [Citrus sinensis]|uniref:Uncharacterized protein n=1 Tax=Citrus sinensis TaxID=2711 RepID=A0ACB8KCX0_CITSI|nr:hypothetical protein KPL71_014584 [Citrus sinensis]